MAEYYTHIKQVQIVRCIQTKLPRRQILTDTNTDVCSVHEHISRLTHLCVMKIKRHLLCWHLLQSHAPPPLLHPSCHNCKNSTNTRTHSHIFTLTHTHHFSCSHLFPLTMALSSWCLCAHSLPQLACNVCVFVRVCRYGCHCLLLPWFQLSSDMYCPPPVLQHEGEESGQWVMFYSGLL